MNLMPDAISVEEALAATLGVSGRRIVMVADAAPGYRA